MKSSELKEIHIDCSQMRKRNHMVIIQFFMTLIVLRSLIHKNQIFGYVNMVKMVNVIATLQNGVELAFSKIIIMEYLKFVKGFGIC